MKRGLRVLAAAGSLSLALSAADAALAQKTGGILKVGHFDSPASMSMHEESTAAVNRPMMLLEHSRLPLAWHDQRTLLGFA
jgi:peptide/nickel transport system substrate-binding protein